MKYLTFLLLTCCTYGLLQAEEPQMGHAKWVCVSKEKYEQLKQEDQDEQEAVECLTLNFSCDDDSCDCDDKESCS